MGQGKAVPPSSDTWCYNQEWERQSEVNIEGISEERLACIYTAMREENRYPGTWRLKKR